ncbi:hypothetical protein B0H34DRAFT_791937 [Crassisporium funariophilum]|nr:hypothetical protein B0H34DRAFT_791937 [Crassisporium funariophilum]
MHKVSSKLRRVLARTPTAEHTPVHETRPTQIRENLPIEILGEIFLWSARIHPETMPALARVSKWFHSSIEPLLYEVVSLFWPTTAHKFLFAIHSKPLKFFENVKTLLITAVIPHELAIPALRVCTHVVNIACWLNQPQKLPVVMSLRPQRISINMSGSYAQAAIAFRDPFFARATRLSFVDPPDLWYHWPWSSLSVLNHLTHLELRGFETEYRLRECQPKMAQILLAVPRLKVIILLVMDEWVLGVEKAAVMGIMDEPRCVVMKMPRAENMQGEWEAYPRGREDRWERAEAIVLWRMATLPTYGDCLR